MYGAAKCRAIFTAVNNRLSAREVLAILADAEPRVVVVDPPAAPLVADVGTLGFDCDTLITDLDYLACWPPTSTAATCCSSSRPTSRACCACWWTAR